MAWYWKFKDQYCIGWTNVFCSWVLSALYVSWTVTVSPSGETPSRTLAETATERARETALAAKEKAKDLASHAQKKQYVWRTTIVSFGAVSGTDLSLRPHLIVFARVQLTDPSQASMRKTRSSVGWTMKGLSWLQKARFSLAVCITESLATLQQIERDCRKHFILLPLSTRQPWNCSTNLRSPSVPIALSPLTMSSYFNKTMIKAMQSN